MKILPSLSQIRYRSRQEPSAKGELRTTEWSGRTVLMGLMVPMLMMVLNLSMFMVALPTIRDAFGVQADVAAWLAMAYTLPFMMFMPVYGRLGDGLGKRRLFLIGIAIFLMGTILTLLAHNLFLLVSGRVIQGIGAGGVNPLCLAIIADLFRLEERGKAMGTWNSIGPFAAIAGPLMGGFLVDQWGWRTIFGPVVLAGMAALVAVWGQVPPLRAKANPAFLRTFDWGGMALLAGATLMLVFYVSSRPITGVMALRDWRLLLVTILLFGAFIVREKRQAAPFVSLEVFRYENFSRASVGAGIRMFTMSGIAFLLPLYLTDIYYLSAAWIGIMLMLHAGALLMTMAIGGHLADRWSSRWPVIIGALIQASTMIYLALLPGATSLGLVVVGLAGHGWGAGLSLASLHRSALSQVPLEEMGGAAGLYSMIRFAGTVLGTALGGVLLQQGLDWSLPVIQAYHIVFWFTAGIALLGVVNGWRLRE